MTPRRSSAQPAHVKRDESFRDAISTVDKRGKRIWIYPKKPQGKFTRWRQYFGYALLILLFAGPFIKITGEPLLMINIMERRFVFFGQVFWPQDFLIFVVGFITFIVFVALFTVAFGRLFCGWACPRKPFSKPCNQAHSAVIPSRPTRTTTRKSTGARVTRRNAIPPPLQPLGSARIRSISAATARLSSPRPVSTCTW